MAARRPAFPTWGLLLPVVLAACSARESGGRPPAPTSLAPLTLAYYLLERYALPPVGWTDGAAAFVLSGLWSPVWMSGGSRTLLQAPADLFAALSPPPDAAVAVALKATLRQAAVDVSVNYLSSWVHRDEDGTRYDVLLDWDTLHDDPAHLLASSPPLAGRAFPDLVWDDEEHFRRLATAGFYAPLDSLLATRAPDLMASYPDGFWDAYRFDDGKIYGIPAVAYPPRRFWVLRTDLCRSVGVPEASDMADLVEAAMALNRSGALEHPLRLPRGASLLAALLDQAGIRPTPALPSLCLYFRGTGTTVHNILEEDDPELSSALALGGRIVHEDLVSWGSLAFATWGAAWFDARQTGELDPGLELEALRRSSPEAGFATLRAAVPAAGLAPAWFIAVPARSPHAGRTISFLNSLYGEDVYDLLHHGAPGVSFRAEGRDRYVPTLSGQLFRWFTRPYSLLQVLVSSPFRVRGYAGLTGAGAEELRRAWDPAHWEPDPLTGFRYDDARVRAEIEEYTRSYHSDEREVLGSDAPTVERLRARMPAARGLIRTIQVDLQSQIDAFIGRR